MYRKIISIIVIFTFFAGVLGCATFGEEHQGATTGAGIGAVTGAAAGALLGSKGAKTEMAILGGLAGALAGGLIGHYAYDQKRTQEETAQKYNYNAAQGPLLRIEDVSVVPATAKPGDTVEMKMTYALLGLGSGKEADITETREIRYETELYGKPQIKVSRADGTYVTSIPITLPNDAQKGKYNVISTVQSPYASDSKEVSFQVN
jgi:uncharacterized protein YcfJ